MATGNMEKTIKKTAQGIPASYNLTCGELSALCKLSKQDLYQAMLYAYYYGFCRGSRAKSKGQIPTL